MLQKEEKNINNNNRGNIHDSNNSIENSSSNNKDQTRRCKGRTSMLAEGPSP